MPKIVDHDAYREELLEASLAPFADSGYAALSMRRIAADLGVSTGTLYHYFDGKQDLFLQLVAHLTDALVRAVHAAVAGAASAAEAFELFLADLAAHEHWYAGYNRICLDHLRARDADAAVAGPGEAVMRATTDQAVDALATGLGLSAREARFVLVFGFGLVTQRDLDGGATPLSDQIAVLRGWFQHREDARGR